MRRTRIAALAVAPVAALSIVALPAQAASSSQLAIAGPGAEELNYLTTSITVKQGATITFLNLDADRHSFTSEETKAVKVKVGKRTVVEQEPDFDTGLINGPSSTKVLAIKFLKPGVYHFYCVLHERMAGTLTVTR